MITFAWIRFPTRTAWPRKRGHGPQQSLAGRVALLKCATGSAGIKVYSPQGKPIGVIEVPYASNCVFGGPDFKTLYVTAADKLLGVKTKVRGMLPCCAKAP